MKCPKCGKNHTGETDRAGWATCRGCGHLWRARNPSAQIESHELFDVEESSKPSVTRHKSDVPESEGISLTSDDLEGVSEVDASCPLCGHAFPIPEGQQADDLVCPQCRVPLGPGGDVIPDDGVDLAIGSMLGGCKILDKLGEGGMGTVFLARQKSLDRKVAIKVLAPEFTAQTSFMRRFEQEAKLLAGINHPNVLHVYDYGEDQTTGRFYMVMEYVAGKDLADVLRVRRRVGEVEVLHILHQAALGLEQATECGIIHRDIKPDNLMLADGGLVKVMDFGLAKASREDTMMTSAGLRVGTPAFMSPEQCDGESVDQRSDIYSLGVTAFVALTGKLPFNGDSPFAIMLKHKSAPVPSVRAVVPGIHPEVETLLRRMMAKDPADRPATMGDLVKDVVAVITTVDNGSEDMRASEPRLRVVDTVRASIASARSDRLRAVVDTPPADRERRHASPELDMPSAQPEELPMSSQQVPDPALDPRSTIKYARDDEMEEQGERQQDKQPSAEWEDPLGGLELAIGGPQREESLPDIPIPPHQQEQLAPSPPPPANLSQAHPEPAPPSPPAAAPPILGSGQPIAPATPSHHEQETVNLDDFDDDDEDSPLNNIPPVEVGGGSSSRSAADEEADSFFEESSVSSSNLRTKPPKTDTSQRRRRQRTRDPSTGRIHAEERFNDGQRLEKQKRYRRALAAYNDAARSDLPPEWREQCFSAIERVQVRMRRRNRRNRLLALLLILAALVANAWLWTPDAHNLLVQQRMRTIAEQPRSQQDELLSDLLAATTPWQWYEQVFKETYDLPALEDARAWRNRLRREAEEARLSIKVDAVEAAVEDDSLSWHEVAVKADELNETALPGAIGERYGQLLERVIAERNKWADAVHEVEAARIRGQIDEGVRRSEEIRATMSRGGVSVEELLSPVPLQIVDEQGQPLDRATVFVEEMQVRDPTLAYVQGSGPTAARVEAEGYQSRQLELTLDDVGDEPLVVALQRTDLWTRPLPAGERLTMRPWLTDSVVLRTEDEIQVLRAETGEVLGRFLSADIPGGGSWNRQFAQRGVDLVVGTTGGRFVRLKRVDDAVEIEIVAAIPGTSALTSASFDMTYRDGSMRAVLIDQAQGVDLVTFVDQEQSWRIDGFPAVQAPPKLIHVPGFVAVLDDTHFHLFEEGGVERGRIALAAERVGPARMMTPNVVLIPEVDRLQVIRIDAEEGVQSREFPIAAGIKSHSPLAGFGVVLVDGDDDVHMFRLHPEPRSEWQQPGPGGAVFPPGQSHEALAVANAAGEVVVMRLGDGGPMRRFQHDGGVIANPVLSGNRVVVAGPEGVTGHHLLP